MAIFGDDDEAGGGEPDKAAVDLRIDRAAALPGDVVNAVATVGAHSDERVQGGRFELLYVNDYYWKDRDFDDRDKIRRRRVDIVVAQAPLPGTPGTHEAALALPPDAPASSTEMVDWLVRAVVDRKMRTDAKAEQPLVVGLPQAALAAWGQTQPTFEPAVPVGLFPSTRELMPGETVSGVMTVTSGAPVKFTDIRVELKWIRLDSPGRNQVVREGVAALLPLAGKGELSAGQVLEFPFSLQLAPGVSPCINAAHNSLRWFVEGVVARRMASDYNGRAELNVYTAR